MILLTSLVFSLNKNPIFPAIKENFYWFYWRFCPCKKIQCLVLFSGASFKCCTKLSWSTSFLSLHLPQKNKKKIYQRTLLIQTHTKLYVCTKYWILSEQKLNVWKQHDLNEYICFKLRQPVGKTNSFGMNSSAWNLICSLFTIVNLIQRK